VGKKILIVLIILFCLALASIFYFQYFQAKSFKKETFETKIPNLASVFCEKQGGKVEVRNLKDGQKGFCIFANGSECDEWDFYNGKCKKGEKFCKDFCGDGICQEVVCLALGCPCPETKETCPKDCKEKEISCTKEGEKVNRNPLIGPTDQKCCQGLVEWRESRSYGICLKPTSEGIIVESPKENEKIKSPSLLQQHLF
jgi:putative hemolysin